MYCSVQLMLCVVGLPECAQHLAWQAGGEVEPTDLKLPSGQLVTGYHFLLATGNHPMPVCCCRFN